MTNVVDANVDVGKSADHANGIDTPDHEELSAYVSRRIEGAVFDEARGLLSRKAHQVEGDPDDLEEWMSGGGRSIFEDVGNDELGPEERADRSSRWRRVEESLSVLDDDERRILRLEL